MISAHWTFSAKLQALVCLLLIQLSASGLAREAMRKIDLQQEENEDAILKHKEEVDFIDVEAGNTFDSPQPSISSIKCCCVLKHCAVWNKIINEMSNAEWLICSDREAWCCVTQYVKTTEMKAEMIIKTKEKLIKNKYEDATEQEIGAMMQDLRRHFAGWNDGYEMNQKLLGMKALFRGFVIKA